MTMSLAFDLEILDLATRTKRSGLERRRMTLEILSEYPDDFPHVNAVLDAYDESRRGGMSIDSILILTLSKV